MRKQQHAVSGVYLNRCAYIHTGPMYTHRGMYTTISQYTHEHTNVCIYSYTVVRANADTYANSADDTVTVATRPAM